MTVPCYYCDSEIPKNQAKRCSRCLLVTYCSKECQVLSWKSSHKINCSPNLTLAALNGTKPKKFSMEWEQLVLTKWLAEWRRCFMRWSILALDLANHPPNRTVTHCLHIIVKLRPLQTKAYQKFSIVDANVVPFLQIQEIYTELATEVDPTELDRLRYAISLQRSDGELFCVRLHEWSIRSGLSWWNELPKDLCASLAASINQLMKTSVENTAPDIVERELRGAQPG